ncbi:MAG: hypothetical protein ACKOTD_00940, partial [Phycisphaerales bacterium]
MELFVYTLVLPALLALYAFGYRKGVPMARRTVLDTVVIGLTCAAMAWAVWPIDQTIKLGRDLRGGVSLVYAVTMPEGVDDTTKG